MILQNPYVDSFLNMFVNMTRDEDEDVRNNAVYGAGELALHGGQVNKFDRFSSYFYKDF